MKINRYPGLLVDIEGPDGSGASTQAALLKGNLKKAGFASYLTKEPTDNIIGGLIRGVLTHVYELSPAALQLLFVADRLHHLDHQLIPMLKSGGVVISDRFLWSTVAFGSINLDRSWLLGLHRYCIMPDITFILRVPPKICLERIGASRFSFELFEKEKSLRQTEDTYGWLAKKYPRAIKVIDGTQSIKRISEEIFKYIRLNPKYRRLKK